MRKQNFNKIKNAVFILLAVFFVISVTAASASACVSSDHKEKPIKEKSVKEKPIKEKPIKEKPAQVVDQKAAQEQLGNKLLDMIENNWFGNGGESYSDNGEGGDFDNGWFGDN